jgi:predicted regulator of Ras-like GTPase activity (Roadblock/LC7/MglB family)
MLSVVSRQDLEAALQTGVAPLPGAVAVLVRRDGLGVLSSNGKPVGNDSFNAMVAAMVGAAESAFEQIEPAAATRVFAESSGSRLLIVGLTSDLLLVTWQRGPAAGADIGRTTDALAARLRSMLGGDGR